MRYVMINKEVTGKGGEWKSVSDRIIWYQCSVVWKSMWHVPQRERESVLWMTENKEGNVARWFFKVMQRGVHIRLGGYVKKGIYL